MTRTRSPLPAPARPGQTAGAPPALNARNHAREYALDEPGSAGPATLRRAAIFSAFIVGLTAVALLFGHIPLAPYPQFTTFHATFVFVADAVTAFLLFGQFFYRRLPSYCILAAAFLFTASMMAPFLLSFPGALRAQGEVIGGPQSSVWIWHLWHTLFPLLVAAALVVHERQAGRQLPRHRVPGAIAAAVALAVLLVSLATATVTVFHDHLPPLIHGARLPIAPYFFWAGSTAALATGIAFLLALRLAVRRRAILCVWLALVLLALLGDEAVSLSGFPRYALGWYLGRSVWIVAASTLLVVFLTDINRLYHRLGQSVRALFRANRRLSALVVDKERVLGELRQSQARIRRLAYHDPVTDLPNRRLLLEELAHVLGQATRNGRPVAVLYVDLDYFKEVNDTYGHDAGDALLKEVGARLVRCVRAGDIVSRLGGDEFVIVLPDIAGPGDADAVADKVLAVIAAPIVVLGHAVQIGVSIGIAVCHHGDALRADELLREADQAMYAAKKAGRDRAVTVSVA